MAVLARVALAGVLLGLAGCSRVAVPDGRAQAVHLRHRAPEGTPVWIVGDFNGWQPGNDAMAPQGGEEYEAVLELPPGTYAYAYAHGLPDGGFSIVTPEGASGYVEDDLGGRDGLIRIPQNR